MCCRLPPLYLGNSRSQPGTKQERGVGEASEAGVRIDFVIVIITVTIGNKRRKSPPPSNPPKSSPTTSQQNSFIHHIHLRIARSDPVRSSPTKSSRQPASLRASSPVQNSNDRSKSRLFIYLYLLPPFPPTFHPLPCLI